MKLAIVGSRGFEDYELLKKYVLSKVDIDEVEMIVSGGAKGADTLAEQFALEFGKNMSLHYPNWEQYGKCAGMIRNQSIVNYADVIMVFWDGASKGTADTIKKASMNLQKTIYVCRYKEDDRYVEPKEKDWYKEVKGI